MPKFKKSETGQDLVNEYVAAIDSIADRAADRSAVVQTRLAVLEAEATVLDGLAVRLGS